MTNDSDYEREKIAEMLGYYSFETIQDHSHQNGVDADDYFFRLIFHKFNEYENKLSIRERIDNV